jgi:hypothetical protein
MVFEVVAVVVSRGSVRSRRREFSLLQQRMRSELVLRVLLVL